MSSKQLSLSFSVRKTRSTKTSVKSSSDSKTSLSTPTPTKQRKCIGPLEATCSPPKKAKDETCKLDVDLENATLRTPKKSSPQKCTGKVQIPFKENKPNKENRIALSPNSENSSSEFSGSSSESNSRKTLTPIRLFQQNVSIYQEAKRAFLTGITTSLCCREKEIETITKFLEDHLIEEKSGSLYISGAPGTGKTACLNHILSAVKFQKLKYKTVFINCTNLKTPQSIYQRIYGELQSKNNSPKKTATSTDILKLLKQYMIIKNKILLILDEIDYLENKDQSILYTIFEWPALENSQLVLVGIANALDLTDRTLPRLQMHSKCRPTLLHFPPYTKEQILVILQDRLKQVSADAKNLIKPAALQFCARKVASVAGDIRKALDVCRRAVELVEADLRKQQVLRPCTLPEQHNASRLSTKTSPANYKCVELPLILSILNEVYGSRLTKQEQHNENLLPLQQKILLCTLFLIVKNDKSKVVTLGKFHEVYSRICKKHQVTQVDQSEFTNLCNLVEARGLISVKINKNVRLSKVNLRINESEIEYALQDKCLLTSILSNVSCLSHAG